MPALAGRTVPLGPQLHREDLLRPAGASVSSPPRLQRCKVLPVTYGRPLPPTGWAAVPFPLRDFSFEDSADASADQWPATASLPIFCGMTEPAFSDEETRTFFDYARRKFAEERWPMSPALRSVREALGKIEPKPEPAPPPVRWVNNMIGQRKRRGRR